MRMWAVIAGWAGLMALAVSLYWLGMTREGSNPPDSHGYTLIVVAIVLGIVATITFLADVAWNTRQPIAKYVSVRRLRWPVLNTGIPNPDQWLLDIAMDNASNPEKYLFAWNQILRGLDLDPETLRPWIEVGISIRNAGVYDILVGPSKGHGWYQGKELPDAIEQDGISRVPRGQADEIRL